MPLTSKDFGWLDNYYIWDAITTLALGGGATQQQIFDIFNGTYFGTGTEPAISLFETQSGIYNSLANLLYTNGQSSAEWLEDIFSTLGSIDTSTSTTSSNTTSIATTSNNTATNTGTIATNTTAIENQITILRTPKLISSTTSGTISVITHSISFYNAGSSAGTLAVNGGSTISIPAGATLNFDAGGLNNRFASGEFVYNATGTTFIISYVQ
jgi:hypothetical protein